MEGELKKKNVESYLSDKVEKNVSVVLRFTFLFHESESGSVMSDTLWYNGLYSSWNSPGQNTGVGSLSLLQGIFPTQGSNPGLPHCRKILYRLSHKGRPKMLERVAYPFSSRFSWPRNQTRVSCIAGRFFSNWAIREDLLFHNILRKILQIKPWRPKGENIVPYILTNFFLLLVYNYFVHVLQVCENHSDPCLSSSVQGSLPWGKCFPQSLEFISGAFLTHQLQFSVIVSSILW